MLALHWRRRFLRFSGTALFALCFVQTPSGATQSTAWPSSNQPTIVVSASPSVGGPNAVARARVERLTEKIEVPIGENRADEGGQITAFQHAAVSKRIADLRPGISSLSPQESSQFLPVEHHKRDHIIRNGQIRRDE